MGRRRVAVVATVLVALAAGTGVAYAYLAPGAADVASPAGYFTFCADRQRDVAGITEADLAGHPEITDLGNDGGPPDDPATRAFGIENYVYTDPGPLVGQGLDGSHPFVLGKSGVRFTGSGAADIRRVMTTQWVEYADAARTQPVQVRCKMRTRESLVKPVSSKQRFDDNTTFSSVPWGFGPLTATGSSQSCRDVNTAIVQKVWNDLGASQASAAFQYPAQVVFGADNYIATGSAWTGGQSVVTAANGVLAVADRSLDSPTTSGAPNDRLRGAYYCTFVAPDYVRRVFLGQVVPPVTP